MAISSTYLQLWQSCRPELGEVFSSVPPKQTKAIGGQWHRFDELAQVPQLTAIICPYQIISSGHCTVKR
jgi:hypothetical protein